MSKKILLIITSITLFIIGASFLNQIACEGQPVNNNLFPSDRQQIWGEQTISQSFIAPKNRLNRIDLLFQTYGRKNSQDVTLLLLDDNGTELYKKIFNASTVRDKSWHSFNLVPFADSKGKKYLITLQSPQSTNGDAITTGGIEQDVYSAGSAFMGAVPIPADMAFRTCYQLTNLEKLQTLLGQMSRYRPILWGNNLFYPLLLLGYILLLVAFFWRLVRLIN